MRSILTMAGLTLGVAVLLVDLVHGAASLSSSSHKRLRSDDAPALQAVVETHAAKLTELEGTITALQNTVGQLQQLFHDKLSQTVAFHARVSHELVVAAGNTFIFDLVHINMGNSYNRHNGLFTVPVDGIYVFFFSVYGRGGTTGAAYLQIDDEEVVFIDGQNEIETGHGIFHLRAEQVVKVVANKSSVSVYSFDTYFTGYLVHSDM